jgi:integrase
MVAGSADHRQAYVFVGTCNRHYGKPFTTRRRFMLGLCKRAGVKEFGFHALRRYVASYLADVLKGSTKTIQDILRHRHLMTIERYVHRIRGDLRAVMNLLENEKLTEELTTDVQSS